METAPPPKHMYALTTWTDTLVEDKEYNLYLERGSDVNQVLSTDIEPLLARLKEKGVQIRSCFCLTDHKPLPVNAQALTLENGEVISLLDMQAGRRIEAAQLGQGGES